MAAETHVVPPGSRAVVFDKKLGVLPDIIGEGTHPRKDTQTPYIFCVRPSTYTVVHPNDSPPKYSEIFSKDSQAVRAEVRLTARPDEARLADI